MKDRIKLAEAMGWTLQGIIHTGFAGKQITRKQWVNPLGATYSGIRLPDPFTDANDDYAVLEWIRSQNFRAYFYHYLECAGQADSIEYQIGDYARAALKVIGDEELLLARISNRELDLEFFFKIPEDQRLVERLRGRNEYWQHAPLYNEAADHIEKLEAVVEAAREIDATNSWIENDRHCKLHAALAALDTLND